MGSFWLHIKHLLHEHRYSDFMELEFLGFQATFKKRLLKFYGCNKLKYVKMKDIENYNFILHGGVINTKFTSL